MYHVIIMLIVCLLILFVKIWNVTKRFATEVFTTSFHWLIYGNNAIFVLANVSRAEHKAIFVKFVCQQTKIFD